MATTNINGVRIDYSVRECPACLSIPVDSCESCKGSGYILAGVTVRGSSEDILPLLATGIVSMLESEVRYSAAFNRECARKDEGEKANG